MFFNINDYIKIKLKPKGIEILKQRHEELKKFWPGIHGFELPKIDKDGFTEMQAWEIMQNFGSNIGMGFDPPFETTVIIEDKYLKEKVE